MPDCVPELSVVVPARNEASRISRAVGSIAAYLRGRREAFEIIVVDDGSSDGTSEALSGAPARVVRLPRHQGKGGAVRAGVLASKGSLVLFVDADLSAPIEELETLLPWLDRGFDAAIGSRALPDSRIEVPQPLYRRVMGRAFSLLVRALLLPGVRDTQCGFKLFKGDAARRLLSLSRLDGYCFDVEVLMLARDEGFKVAEVPIRWNDSGRSQVRPLLDAGLMLMDLLALRSGVRL